MAVAVAVAAVVTVVLLRHTTVTGLCLGKNAGEMHVARTSLFVATSLSPAVNGVANSVWISPTCSPTIGNRTKTRKWPPILAGRRAAVRWGGGHADRDM